MKLWIRLNVLLAVVTLLAAGVQAESPAGPEVGAVTAILKWRPEGEDDLRGGVVLAFGSEGAAPLEVRWERDTTSLFPGWAVYLVSEHGLQIDGKAPKVLPDGRQEWMLAITAVPRLEREYQVTLAYDPRGAFAVQLTDEASGSELYGLGSVATPGVQLGVPQGWSIRSDERVAAHVQVLDRFTPVGFSWRLRRVGPDGSHSELVRPNLSVQPGDTVWVDLKVPAGVSGKWIVRLTQNDETRIVARMDGAGEQLAVPLLEVGAEHVGEFTLGLAFRTEGGELLVEDEELLVAGRVALTFGQPESEGTSAFVPIEAESTFAVEMPLIITATISEIAWNPEKLRYEPKSLHDRIVLFDGVMDLTDLAAHTRVELPIPKRSGSYRVTYSVALGSATEVELLIRNPSTLFVHDLSEARVTIATYNLWIDNEWPRREAALGAVLEVMHPDILAVQELSYDTRSFIDEALPTHARVSDRFAGWLFESNIFWDETRFELVEYGTEDVGIFESWRRLFWVRLRLKELNCTVLVATAHFTYEGHARIQEAKVQGINPRVDQARRSVEALDRLALPGEPVFFMGDFNESGEAIHTLRAGGFIDTVGSKGEPFQATWPADPRMSDGRHVLDWQLFRGPAHVIESKVVEFMLNGVAPSDHKPVLVTYGVFGDLALSGSSER